MCSRQCTSVYVYDFFPHCESLKTVVSQPRPLWLTLREEMVYRVLPLSLSYGTESRPAPLRQNSVTGLEICATLVCRRSLLRFSQRNTADVDSPSTKEAGAHGHLIPDGKPALAVSPVAQVLLFGKISARGKEGSNKQTQEACASPSLRAVAISWA